MFTLNQLQEEMLVWQNHNFPNRPSWIPLMGMTEEFGEMCESHTIGINELKLKDAIMDLAIFGADFANAIGANLETLIDQFNSKPRMMLHPSQQLPIALGKINHAYIKLHQKIRIDEPHKRKMEVYLAMVFVLLKDLCTMYGLVFIEELEKVWSEVKQRDWIKYPKNGRSE